MRCKVCDKPLTNEKAGLNGEILCHSCWDWGNAWQSGAPKIADYYVRGSGPVETGGPGSKINNKPAPRPTVTK